MERVNVVINYDMPDSPDSYLHRVGRAGRFGTKGLGISFVAKGKDEELLKGVQERFEVSMEEMPEKIDVMTYSTYYLIQPPRKIKLSFLLNQVAGRIPYRYLSQFSIASLKLRLYTDGARSLSSRCKENIERFYTSNVKQT